MTGPAKPIAVIQGAASAEIQALLRAFAAPVSGRVVGLVSHVPELRSRITTQLEVVKGRSGSSVRPVLAGG